MKITGICIVMLTSTLIGLILGQELAVRVKNLKVLKKIMTLLHGEIRFAITPIPEALENISEKSPEPFKLFLKMTSEELKQLQTCELSLTWEKNIDKYLKDRVVTAKDLEKLKQLGSTLGYLDKDMQLTTIEQYMQQLEEDINYASEYSIKQGKLYRTLGVLFGIFIAIIFI
ncbi:MAG: hypothetical protein K0R15_91 [Clostridiales bacterium]|jgi:stage III sporulation protein AB|nr:hypothetical protein [Clostridiales bacterium]